MQTGWLLLELVRQDNDAVSALILAFNSKKCQRQVLYRKYRITHDKKRQPAASRAGFSWLLFESLKLGYNNLIWRKIKGDLGQNN